jgi:hypothetical protein
MQTCFKEVFIEGCASHSDSRNSGNFFHIIPVFDHFGMIFTHTHRNSKRRAIKFFNSYTAGHSLKKEYRRRSVNRRRNNRAVTSCTCRLFVLQSCICKIFFFCKQLKTLYITWRPESSFLVKWDCATSRTKQS